MSTIIGNLPVAVVAVKKQGDVIYCNSAARQLFQCNQQCSEASSQHNCPKSLLDWTINNKRNIKNYCYNIELPGGENNQILVSTELVSNGTDSKIAAILTATDITTSQQMWDHWQQAEKITMVSMLAAGVAHEIKNPLTSARGLLQLINNRFADQDEARQHVQVALEGLNRINIIINELEQLAQPTKPKLEFTQLEGLLEKIFMLIESEATYHNVVVQRIYQPNLPFAIIDVVQMKQVFLNLAINAFKAMPGGGKLIIYVNYDFSSHEFMIQFKDNGIGIDEKNLDKIFIPFYTTNDEGTGLGLSICHQLVQNHGGRLGVESELNRGTVVTLYLPVINDVSSKDQLA